MTKDEALKQALKTHMPLRTISAWKKEMEAERDD